MVKYKCQFQNHLMKIKNVKISISIIFKIVWRPLCAEDMRSDLQNLQNVNDKSDNVFD